MESQKSDPVRRPVRRQGLHLARYEVVESALGISRVQNFNIAELHEATNRTDLASRYKKVADMRLFDARRLPYVSDRQLDRIFKMLTTRIKRERLVIEMLKKRREEED